VRKLLDRLAVFGRKAVSAIRSKSSARDTAEHLIAQGNRAEKQGRLHEACDRYREAAAAAPGYSKAHLNLGIGLEAIGDTDGAIGCHEQALACEPADPYANYNLGRLLLSRGVLQRAEQLLGQALRSRPDFPEARIMMAHALQAQGGLEASAVELEVALRQRPDDFRANYQYGLVLRGLDRLADSESALRRATVINPENVDACYDLATLLMARNEMGQAEPYLRAVLARKPDFVEARAALCRVLETEGDLTAATAELEAVLEQRPNWADALYTYATFLMRMDRNAEAEAVLRRIIAIDSSFVLAYRILGYLMYREGRIAEALDVCRAGRMCIPDSFELASLELFVLNFADDVSVETLFGRHREFGERLEATFAPRFTHCGDGRDPERRLRVGYVSSDFKYHPVGQFILPVLERHDRSRFEVYCYATGKRDDEITRQLAMRADVWRNVPTLSELELAEVIQRDHVDILVDLAGHSSVPRLGVFAQQPAPVQAAWLGYLNTTGLKRIRYRITDRYADPPDLTDHLHTESLVRLPHSQWCYRPFISVPAAQTSPVERNGHVTFGSLGQTAKLSPSIRRLWVEVLNMLPESRLVILGVAKGRADNELLRDFAGAGIAAARITIVPWVPEHEYFRWLNSIDIVLDTQPYSGGTTTCDALWMGVPVVTVAGPRSASRSAASVLTTVGLVEWIASTPDDYVRLAVESARDEKKIMQLRASLRQRILESSLMDEPRFVHDLEDAYRHMWQTWCNDTLRS